jgi:hypothetical protein
MKLLNHKFKWPATAVFYGSLLIGIYSLSFENQLDEIWKLPVYSLVGNESGFLGTGLGKKGWTETALFNEILTVVIVLSGFIASFSREKVEDELTTKIRLESLSFAILINYALVLVANFFFFDFAYLYVLIAFLFAPLIMFNLIFQVRLFNYYKLDDEK